VHPPESCSKPVSRRKKSKCPWYAVRLSSARVLWYPAICASVRGQQQQHYALLFCPNTPPRGRQQTAKLPPRLISPEKVTSPHFATSPHFVALATSPRPPAPLPPAPPPLATRQRCGSIIWRSQGIAPDPRELRQIPGKRPDLLDSPCKNRVKAGDLGTFLRVSDTKSNGTIESPGDSEPD
jgi:hypothetical protein